MKKSKKLCNNSLSLEYCGFSITCKPTLMKKIFAIVALMSMSFLHLKAQTFMVNAIVPKERSKCNISKSNESAFVLGGY